MENPNNAITALIVEDDKACQLFFKTIFSAMGHKSECAKDGFEAVEKCNQNPEIKIVLMDLNLPIMNGFTACMKIKEKNANIKIIAQSALEYSIISDSLKEAGFDGFIAKPISQKTLVDLIKSNFY